MTATPVFESSINLDDGSRHVDGDSILSRVVRDRVDGCSVLAKCIVDAVTAGSRVGKSDLGRAVVCVRFLGARKTDGTRDSEVGMAAVIYSEGDFDVLAEDGLGAVVLAAGSRAEPTATKAAARRRESQYLSALQKGECEFCWSKSHLRSTT